MGGKKGGSGKDTYPNIVLIYIRNNSRGNNERKRKRLLTFKRRERNKVRKREGKGESQKGRNKKLVKFKY